MGRLGSWNSHVSSPIASKRHYELGPLRPNQPPSRPRLWGVGCGNATTRASFDSCRAAFRPWQHGDVVSGMQCVGMDHQRRQRLLPPTSQTTKITPTNPMPPHMDPGHHDIASQCNNHVTQKSAHLFSLSFLHRRKPNQNTPVSFLFIEVGSWHPARCKVVGSILRV